MSNNVKSYTEKLELDKHCKKESYFTKVCYTLSQDLTSCHTPSEKVKSICTPSQELKRQKLSYTSLQDKQIVTHVQMLEPVILQNISCTCKLLQIFKCVLYTVSCYKIFIYVLQVVKNAQIRFGSCYEPTNLHVLQVVTNLQIHFNCKFRYKSLSMFCELLQIFKHVLQFFTNTH